MNIFDSLLQTNRSPQTLQSYPTPLHQMEQSSTTLWLPAILISGLVILAVFNLKNIPFVWHFRIVNGLSYVLPSQRTRNTAEHSANVFDTVVTESNSPLAEIDFNLHKSNSTYLSDLDIARTHLICTLFNLGIEAARFTSSEDLIGGGNSQLGAMLAGASCSFKHEIKPYEKYEMWTRVLCWERKWFWVVTWFVESSRNRSKHPDSAPKVFATAVSKCVFKKGRKTVEPEAMMKLSGLLPRSEGSEPVQKPEGMEERRMRGLALVNSSEGLEELHGEFDPNCRVLASRLGLDFSLFLLPKIAYLFGEWVWGRVAKFLNPRHIVQ